MGRMKMGGGTTCFSAGGLSGLSTSMDQGVSTTNHMTGAGPLKQIGFGTSGMGLGLPFPGRATNVQR